MFWNPIAFGGKASGAGASKIGPRGLAPSANGASAKKPAKLHPLVVALHSWNGDYRQRSMHKIEAACIEKGWAYLHPNFRGPNTNPAACGSDLAIADVLDAVAYARRNCPIDGNRIYLVGSSGGGQMALLLAGKHPELWAGVSAWASITDLALWHGQRKGDKYAKDLEAICGGAPRENKLIDMQYMNRSPITWLENAKGLAIDINAGINDGHQGSVPITHSLFAYNKLVPKEAQIDAALIANLAVLRNVPSAEQFVGQDLRYGAKVPMFRREHGNARVTIFNGGHEMIEAAALAWLEKQRRQELKLPEPVEAPE